MNALKTIKTVVIVKSQCNNSPEEVQFFSKAIVLIAFKFVENSRDSKCIFLSSLNLKKRGLHLGNLYKSHFVLEAVMALRRHAAPKAAWPADVVTWPRQIQSERSFCQCGSAWSRCLADVNRVSNEYHIWQYYDYEHW